MNMAGDIRVKTDKKYKNLYLDMKNFAVGDMHELFFICACLGYKSNKMIPLGNNGEDRFWSRTFTPEEYTCFYSMMLEKNDMELSIIKDDKFVISEMEKYANAGMEILIEQLLSDYTTTVNNEYKLDSMCKNELPRALLHFIFERLQ